MPEKSKPAYCSSALGGLKCELPVSHAGSHAADILLDEEGKVDSAVTWRDENIPEIVGATDAF